MIRLTTLLFCLCGFFSKAQNLTVIDINDMSITNDTVFLEIGHEEFDIAVYAGLKNTSAAQINVNITRTEVDVLPWTSSYFCWGSCTGVTTSGDAPIITPSGSVSFGANQQLPATDAGFTFHYDPNNQIGTSLFKVQFFDINNTSDSANVFISITSSDVTNIVEIEDKQLDVYPNPCTDQISHSAKSDVSIFSIEGKLILRTDAATINTSLWSRGQYILQSEGQSIRFVKGQK